MIKITSNNPLAYFKQKANFEHLDWLWDEFCEKFAYKYGKYKVIAKYDIIEGESIVIKSLTKEKTVPVQEYFQDDLNRELRFESEKVLNAVHNFFISNSDNAHFDYFKSYIRSIEKEINEIYRLQSDIFKLKPYKKILDKIIFEINRDFSRYVDFEIQLNTGEFLGNRTLEEKIEHLFKFLKESPKFKFEKEYDKFIACVIKLAKNEDTGKGIINNFSFNGMIPKDHLRTIFKYLNDEILETPLPLPKLREFLKTHIKDFENATLDNFDNKMTRFPSPEKLDYLPVEVRDFVSLRRRK